HTNLRPILKVIGRQSLVTPKVLQLARWIADYYCCPLEIALKSVLPDAVRKEQEGWRERLFVRALPVTGELPKLTRRQTEVWKIIEQHRELPLQELLKQSDTTAETVRKLEDKGLVAIAPQISERDPYAREHILPTQTLPLNPEQANALEKIVKAMDCQRAAGSLPATSVLSASRRQDGIQSPPTLCQQDAGSTLSSPFFSRDAEVHKYSGWLPHWRQADKLYYVSFRLNDSVAQN